MGAHLSVVDYSTVVNVVCCCIIVTQLVKWKQMIFMHLEIGSDSGLVVLTRPTVL